MIILIDALHGYAAGNEFSDDALVIEVDSGRAVEGLPMEEAAEVLVVVDSESE